jgi:mannosyltransferase
MSAVYVTNFNRNFTGVSSTAAAVLRGQSNLLDLRLVGQPLPGCGVPIPKRDALLASRVLPDGKPFSIWHVRRNSEMRLALFARDVLRLPIRIVFTSAAIRRHSAFPRWLISRMDAVIATSEMAASFVPHVRAIVPHGVDTVMFQPAADRAVAWRATGHPGTCGMASVGRIRPEKGTDRFVAAAIAALPSLPGLTALVIGKATAEHQPFLKSLQKQVSDAGMSDRILFTGEIGAVAMPELYRALSLLVAVPRYEGFGMTALEAMASGVPVLLNRCGHFPAFLGEGKGGQLIESNDIGHISDKVQALMSNQRWLQQLAEEARAQAADSFGIEREVAGIGEVYEALWQAR